MDATFTRKLCNIKKVPDGAWVAGGVAVKGAILIERYVGPENLRNHAVIGYRYHGVVIHRGAIRCRRKHIQRQLFEESLVTAYPGFVRQHVDDVPLDTARLYLGTDLTQATVVVNKCCGATRKGVRIRFLLAHGVGAAPGCNRYFCLCG